MRIEIEMERVESESTTLAVSFSALRGVSFVSVAAVVVVEGCEEEEEETSVAAAAAVAGLKSRRDCAGGRQPHNAGQGEAAGNVTVALEVTGAEGGNGQRRRLGHVGKPACGAIRQLVARQRSGRPKRT